MKYVRLTALLGVLPLLLLLLTGCTKDETVDNKDKAQGITIALTIPASESALTKATTVPLEGENTLSNVYVLFYPNTGGNSVPPSYFHQATLNTETEWTHSIIASQLIASLTPGVRYEVYVVASLPSGTTVPTSLTTKGDLLALFETQFERTTAPLMSFSGKGEVTYVPNVSSTVEIPLRRTVARLDITLQGLKTGQTAELQLTQASATPYFEKERLATSEFRSDMLTADASGIYRAYVYENYPSDATASNTQLVLTVQNNGGSIPTFYTPIVVNNGKIERNKIYAYNIDVTPDPITIGYFGGWDDVNKEYTKPLEVEAVASSSDPEFTWDPTRSIVTGAYRKQYGPPNIEMIKAVSPDLSGFPAAKYCYDKSEGWYLPSQNQLMAIWVMLKGLPSEFALSNTAAHTANSYGYWSSTEMGGTEAWYVSFFNGYTVHSQSSSGKNWAMQVRCVRDVTP